MNINTTVEMKDMKAPSIARIALTPLGEIIVKAIPEESIIAPTKMDRIE